jgi:outer membrane lipopolysaccharide assembly protein LptE/RlpB
MKEKIYIILLFLILTACGFELEKNLNTTNFYISEIKTIGDKRII